MGAAQLYLITPVIAAPDAFAPRLEEACAAGAIAAVLLRLALADERTLVNRVKALGPIAQARNAALLVAVEGAAEIDLPAIAARGGADGVHAGPPLPLRALRERLKDGRILGAGNLRSKRDAMEAGEAGADYVLFGEPRADGSVPALDVVTERAAWWAEIFEPPCVAYAPTLEAVAQVAATQAEFVALGDAVWTDPRGPGAAVAAAQSALGSKERLR